MKKVTVLMSAYNGEKYISEQIDSVLSQENVAVKLIIRDDGSSDRTIEIINDYIKNGYDISLSCGQNCGPARSFWRLLIENSGSDYYAFCDQDDIWDENKLFVAINRLELYCNDLKNTPSMYYCNTCMVDCDNRVVIQAKERDYMSVIPTFPQLVMENNASGCTMVWNAALHNIAKSVVPSYLRMHDHLLYLICQYCGGFVYHDNDSYIRYRQHGQNVVGGGNGLKKYINSIRKYLKEDSGLVRQALQLEQISNYPVKEENLCFVRLIKKYNDSGKYCWKIYKKVRQGKLVKRLGMLGLILLRRF